MSSCAECGSTKGVHKFKRKTPLCWSHYLQMRRHGKLLTRTKYSPNDFIEREEYCEIVLYAESGEERARAIIDLDDMPRAMQRKWHLYRSSTKSIQYVMACDRHGRVTLHEFILGKRKGLFIDHRNGNGLDCRKANLRHLTHQQNVLNRTRRKPKSGRIGVWWRASRNRWVAAIRVNGKAMHRLFVTFEEACQARQEMERRFVGATAEEITGNAVQ